MDNRAEVRDFLSTRRARITPEQAGLPLYGANRRVTGLRREEVALLAGISTDYYTRLERGNLGGASDSVLDAIAAALKLDEAERTHLLDLAQTANSSPRQRRRTTTTGVREGVQRIIDSMSMPAYVRNDRLDILAVNDLGAALFTDLFADSRPPANLARYLFLDERSHDFYLDWETVARDVVSSLRTGAGRNPYDRRLSALIGELTTRNEHFATWWATHNVKIHSTSRKRMHHPDIGDVELAGEALALPGDAGLTIITYTVEPGTRSADAIQLLASLAATERTKRASERTAN